MASFARQQPLDPSCNSSCYSDSIQCFKQTFSPPKGVFMKRTILVTAIAMSAALTAPASAQTLKTVKDRGVLSCGVSQGLPGFSAPDDKGNWAGLDVMSAVRSQPRS